MGFSVEATGGFEPAVGVLQTPALPLGYAAPKHTGRADRCYRPTEGQVTWDRKDIVQSPNRLRGVLGYLPQDFGIYPNLNAIEFVQYLAAAKRLDGKPARRRIDELLERIGSLRFNLG